jgi:hypothetical protein
VQVHDGNAPRQERDQFAAHLVHNEGDVHATRLQLTRQNQGLALYTARRQVMDIDGRGRSPRCPMIEHRLGRFSCSRSVIDDLHNNPRL